MKKSKNTIETIKFLKLMDITKEEQESLDWLLTLEESTIENICSIIEKAKITFLNEQKSLMNDWKEVAQNLLLEWAKIAVVELERFNWDESTTKIRNEGKAIIKEIEGVTDEAESQKTQLKNTLGIF